MSEAPDTCPGCGRPRTTEGQPSKRWHYACGSYLYAGETVLRYVTDICETEAEHKEALAVLHEVLLISAGIVRKRAETCGA